MLVAGAAAGMTAIFGTPVAAMLLAVGVLLFEWKPRSFVPVTVAALTAIAWRPASIGAAPMFALTAPLAGNAAMLAGVAALGLATGLFASLLSSALYRIEDGFHHLPLYWMWWPVLGGLVVGLGALVDLRVLGGGLRQYSGAADRLQGASSNAPASRGQEPGPAGSPRFGHLRRHSRAASHAGRCLARFRQPLAAGRPGALRARRHGRHDERLHARP